MTLKKEILNSKLHYLNTSDDCYIDFPATADQCSRNKLLRVIS